jgi:protein-L-isoaspartate(D-aspartate) O-methyltransferase
VAAVTARHTGIGMTSQRTRLRMVERLRGQGIRDEAVLAVMGELPRHIFVDEALASHAYEDISLPLGFGQTISSPHTVARMTELALGGRSALEKVLEIGTGCGYQTAVLAKLIKQVYSMERLAALLNHARRHLREVRLVNVHLRHGDGLLGMPQIAPFDAIVMTAAAARVPEKLVEQLKPAGRLVMPISTLKGQQLCVVERTQQGYTERRMDQVKFVPLLPGVE